MKKIITSAAFVALGLCGSSFAQGQPGAEGGQRPNFEQHKAQMVQRITEHLNCVKNAKNHEELQACRPQRPEGAMQRPPMQDGAQGQRPMPPQGGMGQDGQRRPMPQGPGQKPG